MEFPDRDLRRQASKVVTSVYMCMYMYLETLA